MLDKIKSFYENYDEDNRLFKDKAHLAEYLTTIRYFDQLFQPNSQILDACAGTGRYSFYLANKGHNVTACDLVEHNINIIKSKPIASKLTDIFVCNVLDLSAFKADNFDVVLCMGAMYHFGSDTEKTQAIRECVRVCKPNGYIVLSYMNYFAVTAAELKDGLANINDVLAAFEDESDFMWKATTPAKMELYAKNAGLDVTHNIGADGLSFILRKKVNTATDEDFEKWMNFIYKHCENPALVGCSMHGLLIGKKKGEHR